MKKILLATIFLLASLAVVAQTPSGTMPPSAGQTPSASPQMPSAPGGAAQNPATPGAPDPGAQVPGSSSAANAPITSGCLGGTNPNFTITDTAGTTYKLNIPPGTDASVLNSHIGESVQVMGTINKANAGSSIEVTKIGRGSGNCPASKSSGQATPK